LAHQAPNITLTLTSACLLALLLLHFPQLALLHILLLLLPLLVLQAQEAAPVSASPEAALHLLVLPVTTIGTAGFLQMLMPCRKSVCLLLLLHFSRLALLLLQ
jgi:hypothetical protein